MILPKICLSSYLKWLLLLCGLWLMAAGSTQAQANIALTELVIEIWPEYDNLDTLVIYRGQLADTVPLPANLTFQLPAYLQEMNAVAVASNEGQLVNHPYELQSEDDFTRLDLIVDVPNFQFEYYDPQLLTRNETERVLSYQVTSIYPANNWIVQFLEPPTATEVQFSFEPIREMNTSGLTFHLFQPSAAGPQTDFALEVNYQKTDDRLVVENTNLAGVDNQVAAAAPVNAVPVNIEDTQGTVTFAYWLIGLGGLLLIGAAGWWFFTTRQQIRPIQPRGSQPTKRAAADRFCYQCGTLYQTQAHFCHHCGAARREPR